MAAAPNTVSMNALPTSLKDLFPAPELVDAFGNRLYKNWTVSFPQYRFNVAHLQSVRFSYYQAQAAWPNLYSFVGQIINETEPNPKAKQLLRKVVVGATSGDPNMMKDLTQGILEYRSLLACVIIGLIVSFILVPIAACLTYCLVKRRYTNNFRYNPYSSDSLATAAYDQRQQRRQFRESTISNSGSANHSATWPSSSYSHGFVALIVIAIISGLLAVFGVGASFYFNNSFSFSLNRTVVVIDDAVDDISDIASDFANQFDVLGRTLQDDVKSKMDFALKAMDSLGGLLNDQVRIVDLLQRSQALLLFFMLLSWEKSTVEPIVDSLLATQTVSQRYIQIESNLMRFKSNYSAINDIRNLCSSNYNPVCSLSANMTRNPSAVGTGNNNNNSSVCYTCILPNYPPSLDPLPIMYPDDPQRLERTINAVLGRTNDMMKQKLGQMVTRDDLLRQFNDIKTVSTADFNRWVDHYKAWYEVRVRAVIEGGGSNCPLDGGDETYWTFKPATTPPPNVTLSTLPPAKTTPSPTSTTTKVVATTTPASTAPSGIERALLSVREGFNDRHFITLALLILATIQLALMLVGSVCLLIIYCRGVEQSRNFRARQPTMLEKVGRSFVIAGSIIFVAFTGPLLCLLASAHFIGGGLIDKTVCDTIRARDYTAIDQMLNFDDSGKQDNILRHVLPSCIIALIDSLDKDLLNQRMTIGKFLSAAQSGATINQLLQLNDTTFIRDVKNLTYLQMTSRFVVYNDNIRAYMNNITDISAAHGFFQDLINNITLSDGAAVNATLKNCTSCVVNSVNSSSVNATNRAAILQRLQGVNDYKNLLSQYLVFLPQAYYQWGDSVEMLAAAVEQRDLIVRSMRFVENYFQVILKLLKNQISYMIVKLVDNLSEGLTLDIGQLRTAWELYDGLVREYGCVELVGAMNAFWFFVGIYLIFSTVSSLLLIATYAALTSMSRNRGAGSDYWQSRSLNVTDVSLAKTYTTASLGQVSSRAQLTLNYSDSSPEFEPAADGQADDRRSVRTNRTFANSSNNENKIVEAYDMSPVIHHGLPQSSPSSSSTVSAAAHSSSSGDSSEDNNITFSRHSKKNGKGAEQNKRVSIKTTTFSNTPEFIEDNKN